MPGGRSRVTMGMPGVTNTSQFRLFISNSALFRETRTEHRCFALGLVFGDFVLKHIPVFLKNPVFDPHDVGSNPIHGGTTTTESPMNNYVVLFSHIQTGLVLQCGRSAPY